MTFEQSTTNLGLISLQSKFYHIANFLLFLAIGIINAQTPTSETVSKKVLFDSIPQKEEKKPLLLAEVQYKAKDCVQIDRQNNRAKVKGANIVKKHLKATKEKKGGIISKENFINISNLSLFKEDKIKNKTKEVKK